MENKRKESSKPQPSFKRHNKPSKSESTEGSEFVDDNSYGSEKFERSDEANQNKHGGSLETT